MTATGYNGSTSTLSITHNVVTPSYSISGKVFDDQNANGARDAGEPGLAGVWVFMSKTCNWSSMDASVYSGADGSYTFTGLEPSTPDQLYCIGAYPTSGYKVTQYPGPIWTFNADVTGMDIGFTNQPLFSWTPAMPNEGGTATFTGVDGWDGYAWKITAVGANYRFERIVQDIAEWGELMLFTEKGIQDRAQWLQGLKRWFLPNDVVAMAYQAERNLPSKM